MSGGKKIGNAFRRPDFLGVVPPPGGSVPRWVRGGTPTHPKESSRRKLLCLFVADQQPPGWGWESRPPPPTIHGVAGVPIQSCPHSGLPDRGGGFQGPTHPASQTAGRFFYVKPLADLRHLFVLNFLTSHMCMGNGNNLMYLNDFNA